MAKGVGGAQMFEVGLGWLGWLLEQRSLQDNSNIPTPGTLRQIPKNHLVYFFGFILWICVICGTYQVCSGGLRTGTF